MYILQQINIVLWDIILWVAMAASGVAATAVTAEVAEDQEDPDTDIQERVITFKEDSKRLHLGPEICWNR